MRLKLNGIENLNEIEPIIIKIDQKKNEQIFAIYKLI